MKIHTVNGSHIIETSGSRPFKVSVNGRTRSFATIGAAAKAQAASIAERQAQATHEEKANNSWKGVDTTP